MPVARAVTTSTTFDPVLNTIIDLPAGTAIPVPVEFLTVTSLAKPLLTMYCFSILGTIKLRAPPEVPVKLRRKLRAV